VDKKIFFFEIEVMKFTGPLPDGEPIYAFQPRRRASRRYRLHEFLEGKTVCGVYFQYTTVFLIFVSIVTFLLSTVKEYRENYEDDFAIVEALTALVFTAEYAARVYALPEIRSPENSLCPQDAAHKSRIWWMLTDYYSWIDILSFLPFYVDLVTPKDDFPATQFLRVLRIERMLRVEGRLLHAFNFFERVFKSKGKLFVTTGFVGLTVWILCSSLYYLTERHNPNMVYCPEGNGDCYNRFESIPSSMYFCLLNLFGEFPLIGEHSTGGKVVASFVAIFAVAVFAIPTGIIGSEFQAMIDERRKERKFIAVSSLEAKKKESKAHAKKDTIGHVILNSTAFNFTTLVLVATSTISFYLSMFCCCCSLSLSLSLSLLQLIYTHTHTHQVRAFDFRKYLQRYIF